MVWLVVLTGWRWGNGGLRRSLTTGPIQKSEMKAISERYEFSLDVPFGDLPPEIAKLAREHGDSNILILPARFVSVEEGVEILKAWLDAGFAGGRHSRRVEKIEQEPG